MIEMGFVHRSEVRVSLKAEMDPCQIQFDFDHSHDGSNWVALTLEVYNREKLVRPTETRQSWVALKSVVQ